MFSHTNVIEAASVSETRITFLVSDPKEAKDMTETLAPNSSAANEEGKKPEGRAWREKPYLKYYNS